MSHAYYQALWHEAQNDLKRNLSADVRLKKKGPLKDPNRAKWFIGHLYMGYVRIANKLDDCYDQMVHPQKREVLGRLLDMTLGRLLELKSEIVRIELDDYCFFDNILIELKLTHQDVEIQVPKYFWRDREKTKEHRRELINEMFKEAERENFKNEYLQNFPDEEKEEAWEKYLAKEEQQRQERKKFEEQQRKILGLDAQKTPTPKRKESKRADRSEIVAAVALIQRHERARQGRAQALIAKKKKELKNQQNHRRPTVKDYNETFQEAAKVIQRHWKKHRKRVQEKKAKTELLKLFGAEKPSYKDDRILREKDRIPKLRRELQDKNEKEYREALVTVKEKVTTLYSVPMEEDTVDEIRAWFMWFFDKTNYLPNYPPEKPVIPKGEILGVPKKLGLAFIAKFFPETKKKADMLIKGSNLGIALAGITAISGSALVVAGHWIGPEDFLVCQKELERLKKAGKKAGDTKKDKLALKKKMAQEERKRLLAEESLGFQLRDSSYLVPLNKADRDYRVTWMNLDESKNFDQRYIHQFVKDEKCWELAMEVRLVVDEMMRLELDILKDALERDKHPKRRKRKKKKRKAKKKKRKGKKKAKKDPTGDRTLDDLFLELFRNGIIRDYEEVHLKDYHGERSFGAFDMRKRGVEWPPSTGDVRDLLLQICILPLGSSRIHQLTPLVKSVCLIGSENSGKEFLARVVCTETASIMFDLTPSNIAGKYPGKDGLKMLRHLVEKMSRALQPSVIFVDGAEKTFYKKVPKDEKELEPKRAAGLIKKVVKGIKPPDQVLLLGVSSRPWMARKRKFLKTYQKLILVPQMDYASYANLWQTILSSYHTVPREFDSSCLAKVSDGFSVKTIMEAVKEVLSIQRAGRSKVEPYRCLEFLEELLKTKPTDPKLRDKCLKFYAKTDLPKKRAKMLEEIKQEREKARKV